MSPSPQSGLYAIPIPSRPSHLNLRRRLVAAAFVIVFNAGCIMINITQLFVFLPLRLFIALVPTPLMQRLHEAGVRWSKGCFGELLVLMCQWFSPTRMILTLEGDNLKEEDVIIRGPGGRVVKLNLPEKLVLISNHQIYADWWYLWCLTYKAGLHKDVLIVLKNSLKWIPIVGWGMQVFHFIFLARSWASDRLILAEKLQRLAARAQLRATPLALMIYPEGTLVSKDTRPVSKKFADKCGIEDMRHTLLPRSTGLHYCLRSLSPQIPGLHLLDVTVAYEGIPRAGYGQSYFTLRSIFLDGVPPPRIHVHLRLYDVRRNVPLGDLSGSVHSPISPIANGGNNLMPPSPGILSPTTPGFSPVDPFQPPIGRISRAEREKQMDPTSQEAAKFEQWLRNLWREKDALLEHYLATGTFADRPKANVRDSGVSVGTAIESARSLGAGEAEIPVELGSRWETLAVFAPYVPALAWMVRRKVF